MPATTISFCLQKSWRNLCLNSQDGCYYLFLLYNCEYYLFMKEVYLLSATWWCKGNISQKFMTDTDLDKKGNPENYSCLLTIQNTKKSPGKPIWIFNIILIKYPVVLFFSNGLYGIFLELAKYCIYFLSKLSSNTPLNIMKS